MINILHLSDFHLSDDTGWEFKESPLCTLKTALQNDDIHFLVITGDIVDAKSLFIKARDHAAFYADGIAKADKIDKLISLLNADSYQNIKDTIIKEYNEHLIKEYRQAYAKAKQFLYDLITYLGVSSNDVIMCPGNHDAMRLLSKNNQFPDCVNVEESMEAISLMHQSYLAPFNDFCKNLAVCGSSQNAFVKKSNVDFLCINTNFPIKNEYRPDLSCSHCKTIKELIDGYESTSKPLVTISHEPIESICENMNFVSDEANHKTTIFEKVERMSVLLLSGDKHTSRVKEEAHSASVTCGNPLKWSSIQYALLEISEENEKHHKVTTNFISYDENGNWMKVPTLSICENTYRISKPHIKPQSFRFVNSSFISEKDTNKKFSNFEHFLEYCETERFCLTSDFFMCAAHLIPRNSESESRIKSQTVYETIVDELVEKNEFSVSGNPGVGKSTLLGVVYLKLLCDFANGKCRYLPFYYNIQFGEKKPKSSSDNQMAFYDEEKNAIKDFINECIDQAKNCKRIPLFIIDGLDKRIVWETDTTDTIENYVLDLLYTLDDELMEKCGDKPKLLLGIDEYTDLDHAVNEVLDSRPSTGIRLDGITVSLLERYKTRFIKMVEVYLTLFNNYSDVKGKAIAFYNKCREDRIIDVDYHFLDSNATYILEHMSEPFSITKWVADKTNNIFANNSVRNAMAQCAYEMEVHKKSFKECCEIVRRVKLTSSRFEIIKNKPDIRKYLVASHLKSAFKEDLNDNISLLNTFIDRRVMSYMRCLTKNPSFSSQISGFYSKIQSNPISIDELTMCNLAYIFSDCKMDGSVLFDKISCSISFPRDFSNHSEEISKILTSTEVLAACKYVEKLINNADMRVFVRRYQRLYYGDLDWKQWQKLTGECIQDGFDYFRCFQTLSVKIDNYLESHKRYNLLEYDLFTLCDLTFSRLQTPTYEDINRQPRKTLFYDSSYVVRGQIITCLRDLLKKYLSCAKENDDMVSCHNRPLVHHYFEYAKNQLEKIVSNVEGYDDEDGILLVTCAKQYNSLLTYLNTERLGWRIRSRMTGLEEQDYSNLAESNKFYGFNHQCISVERRKPSDPSSVVISESENNKVSSTLMIAELFLPKKAEDFFEIKEENGWEKYDKSTVIGLLLLRHCGKGLAGDCTPASSREYLEKNSAMEHQYTCDILMPFILQGRTELDDIFHLINSDFNRKEQDNINIVIANEIETIQLEYQYYLVCKNHADKYNDAQYFDEERKDEFKRFFDGKIAICKYIEKTLIKDNPLFIDAL